MHRTDEFITHCRDLFLCLFHDGFAESAGFPVISGPLRQLKIEWINGATVPTSFRFLDGGLQ